MTSPHISVLDTVFCILEGTIQTNPQHVELRCSVPYSTKMEVLAQERARLVVTRYTKSGQRDF